MTVAIAYSSRLALQTYVAPAPFIFFFPAIILVCFALLEVTTCPRLACCRT